MKGYQYAAAACFLTAALFAGGCAGQGAEAPSASETAAVAETSAASGTEAEETSISLELPEEAAGEHWVEKSEDAGEPEQMALYASLPFSYGEAEWELRLYAQEDMVADGELLLDDRCHFQIRAVSGEGAYILLDETIQLGVPAGDVWTDTEGRLHVVVREAQSARYRVTDYIYEEETGAFCGQTVIDGDGINYWGTVGSAP